MAVAVAGTLAMAVQSGWKGIWIAQPKDVDKDSAAAGEVGQEVRQEQTQVSSSCSFSLLRVHMPPVTPLLLWQK